MISQNEIFSGALRSHVAFLKDTSSNFEAYIRAIASNKWVLIPLGRSHLSNKNIISEFNINPYGLVLSDVVSLENCISFLVEDLAGNRAGYVSVVNYKFLFHEVKLTDEISSCHIDSGMIKKALNKYFRDACGIDFVHQDCLLSDGEFVPSKLILTAGPSISALEISYAYDAAKNGWNSEWSKYLTKFEKEFAKYVGVKYALATSSCTGALQIALMSLDIGPGDEVIVPDQTWVATANAVRYVGAIPVFADIELDTWNIDASSIETLITPKTKAVIVVHMYGHPARMSKILEVARKHGLKVVEDAAPAIGAEWQGKRCGSFGEFAAFSFQGAKLLVTGEGGMLVTNDDALYEKAKKVWDQGRNPSKVFWIDGDGVKFKMSNIQAALGLGQLERADELIEMKRRLFNWYEEGLADVPHIRLNKEVEGARSIYWMSSLFLDESAPIDRDELIKQLKARNIDTRPVFPAISQYPIWPRPQTPQPTALRVGFRAINLPSGVRLNKAEVMYVCRKIAELIK